MNMTFHLTNECNLTCKYCYQTRSASSMTDEIAIKAVDFSVAGGGGSTGICFFGGEPLLKRELIRKTIEYCNKICRVTNHKFSFKVVTNGTLLDEYFIKFATDNKITIAFSHDGIMQDDMRIFPDGKGTAKLLEDKILLVLKYQPYAIAMCTVNPETVDKFADSVEWLFNKGFRNILTTPSFDRKTRWTDETLAQLEEQYHKISKLYIKWTLENEQFYFYAFENKIETHIMGDYYKHKSCKLGQRQISIATDGSIYPCIQFVGDSIYKMGDVFNSISSKQMDFVKSEGNKSPEGCKNCELNKRCKYNCCCLNKQCTGSIDEISPFQCNHEQILISVADEIANELFARKNTTFLQKQYNEFYPLLNME